MKLTQLCSVVVAGMMATGAAFAQEAPDAKMKPGTMEWCRTEMMECHQKMTEKMKAQDAELDKLVAAMNEATGEKKVDAVAAVVAKMVEQRKEFHAQMGKMCEKMMEGMKAGKLKKMMEKMKGGEEPAASPKPED